MADWQDNLKRFEFSKDTNSIKPTNVAPFSKAVKAFDHGRNDNSLNNHKNFRDLSTERERPFLKGV